MQLIKYKSAESSQLPLRHRYARATHGLVKGKEGERVAAGKMIQHHFLWAGICVCGSKSV